MESQENVATREDKQTRRSSHCSTLRAMTLQYQPELTRSVWVDTYLSDEDECQLPRDELIERLKQGVRDGEWVAWRLIRIEQEVMGNVD